MNTKYTPGPWKSWNIGLGPKSKGPYTFPLGRDPDIAAANARLIAAAPEMLEALKLAQYAFECALQNRGYINPLASITKAIAKVEGE